MRSHLLGEGGFRPLRSVIPVLALVLMAGMAHAQPQPVKLRAGDGVRVLVWRDIGYDNQVRMEDLGLAGDHLIDGKGNILLPMLGEVRAAGHSPQGLAESIQQSLAIKTIRIVCLPLLRVTLLGAVQRPGSYLMQPNESLWELVNKAGGPANDVDIRKIRVMRSGRTVIDNLMEGFEKAHSLEELGVQSGDQVIVPSISRIGVGEVLRYATFAMSVGIFYLQMTDRNRR